MHSPSRRGSMLAASLAVTSLLAGIPFNAATARPSAERDRLAQRCASPHAGCPTGRVSDGASGRRLDPDSVVWGSDVGERSTIMWGSRGGDRAGQPAIRGRK